MYSTKPTISYSSLGVDTATMKRAAIYKDAGWDVGNIWFIDEKRDYPRFTPVERGTQLNDGLDTLTTKSKLRGSGKSLKLQFRTEKGKDLQILGYAIDMIGRSRV